MDPTSRIFAANLSYRRTGISRISAQTSKNRTIRMLGLVGPILGNRGAVSLERGSF